MKNNVLILGAGMVAKPIVNYLLDNNFNVTLADLYADKAKALIGNKPNGTAIEFSIDNTDLLDKLVSNNNLTVSLLPYKFHVQVAKVCIKHKKNMLTTSYVSPEMQALDQEAKNAGIIILNEIGLDPGIDHMSAMRIIDKIHGEGGQVVDFYSITGALPEREAVNNPFAYSFSWSPKGVILASNNSAKYLKQGELIETPTQDLFKDTFNLYFPEVGVLEVYPNRNSTDYIDIYGIPEAKTVYRGTFRYEGWCEIMDKIKAMNLISNTEMDFTGMSYKQFVETMINDESDFSIEDKISNFFDDEDVELLLDALYYIDLLSDKDMGYKKTTPFEITSDRMISKMILADDASDMVAMQHIFLAEYEDGRREVIKSSLLNFGNPQTDTAIARTVALPAAIGVKNILSGIISEKGVLRPTLPTIYNPVLDELETLGIKMIEEYGLPMEENIQ